MKKLLLSVVLLFVVSPAFAANKEFLYTIKNAEPAQITAELSQKLENSPSVDKANNVLYSVEDKYYIKAYPSNANTELFLYSTGEKTENINAAVKNLKYKAYTLEDKDTVKKYSSDFQTYSKENNLQLVKAKNDENKAGYKKYNPYSKNINNKVIEKLAISSNDIQIKRIQYVPKAKVKKKANEYEYIITNNTGKDVVINKVASEGFIGLNQIAAYCIIPQWQDFVPFYGIVYGAQTDVEKNKFTRPHPVDETIKSGDSMRVLALSKKKDNPVADFDFTVGNQKFTITFDPAKGEKL